ncbi:MAG: peptide MFS transporter [Polyangiaceae bacterium]
MSEAERTAPARHAHPRGLAPLFLTEMWERFCYYGMRALLVLYLVEYQGWEPSRASTVYKWYTSLVYLTPVLGGVLADRVTGLRASIIAGGVLMATGEFLLTFSQLSAFYLGLGLLILGNGLFKPNISTIVGKMYRPGDPRRDGAFTIFYMGINLGAGLSPIVCGYLREHYGFRYGFAAAGIGLLVGIAIFVWGQRGVLRDVEAAGNDLRVHGGGGAKDADGTDESEIAGAGGAAGLVSAAVPFVMLAAAVALPLRYLAMVARGEVAWSGAIMPCAMGAIAGWMGATLLRLKGAARDKSVVIFVVFAFAVLFWMAFEQAGNALNLWAAFHTRLEVGSVHYPPEWWQSVNAVLIVVLAPLFALGWTWLGERGKEPSTPAKMFAAMVLMTLSFVAMVGAARSEEATENEVFLASLPAGIPARPAADGRLLVGDADAGRLSFDPAAHRLRVRGALPGYVVSRALIAAAPPPFVSWVEGLERATRSARVDAPVAIASVPAPPGFDLPFDQEAARDKGVSWDASTATMTFTRPAESPTRNQIAAAGAPRDVRDALTTLETKSAAARVSGLWLFLSYLLATLGELCLSPVGLSMVTKLAPVRLASVFMGVWLLAGSVGQYAGGSLGESWGIVTPTQYFSVFVWTSLVGAALLAVLVRPLRNLMHEVH